MSTRILSLSFSFVCWLNVTLFLLFCVEASLLQVLAKAALQSGLEAKDIRELASLGSYGDHPGNCHRDLVRKIAPNLVAPASYEIQIPMKARNKDSGEMETMLRDHNVLLAVDWFSCYDASGLAHRVFGTEASCETFWNNHSADDPKFFDNPYYNDATNKKGAVPLMLFGDGASHAEYDSVVGLGMRSLLTKEQISNSMFLLACLPKSATAKDAVSDKDSWKEIWKVIVWDFTFLSIGVHPTVDHLGKAWPSNSERANKAGQKLCPNSKLHGVIWVLAGDYEFMENEYGLSHHSSNNPCSWCACNKSDVPFNDFSASALWKDAIRTVAYHRSNPISQHLVLTIPGVVFDMFHLDVLHCLDLGISVHIFGNLFWDLCADQIPGTRQKALADLNKDIQEFYKMLNIPAGKWIPYLSYNHFHTKSHKYPELRHVKAARVRAFAPVAVKLAEKYETADRHTKHRLQMCILLDKMYQCVNQTAMRMDVSTVAVFKKSIENLLAHYQYLANWSMNTPGKGIRYSIVNKHHYSVHFHEQAQFLAPRMFWTYPGESFMGLLGALCQACSRGRSSHSMSKAVNLKFAMAKHLELAGIVSSDADWEIDDLNSGD